MHPRILVTGVALAVVANAIFGCQLKTEAVAPNFITADPQEFTLQSVEKYADPQGDADFTVVVIKGTYTNDDVVPQTITASKFTLVDPNAQAVYYGLTGGDIYIPEMGNSTLQPGKSIAIALGFRVPSQMSGARLVYHQ